MPAVSVIIPTLLGGQLLEDCLRALDRQNYRDFEVLIVNNGRTSVQPEAEAFGFPVRVLLPGANIGFGAAVNLAVRSSSAAVIVTLNDDTEPDAGWLGALVQELLSDPRTGMCASKVRFFDTEKLDSAGMLVCLDGSSKQRGGSMAGKLFDEPGDVLLPSGCAAAYRRTLLDEIGLFPLLRRHRSWPACALGRLAVPLCAGGVGPASLLTQRPAVFAAEGAVCGAEPHVGRDQEFSRRAAACRGFRCGCQIHLAGRGGQSKSRRCRKIYRIG